MATAKKSVPMCCVRVGYSSYLMPADKGMRLVEAMQSAVECQKNYGTDSQVYYVEDQPRVSLTMVKPSQVRQAVRKERAVDVPRLLD